MAKGLPYSLAHAKFGTESSPRRIRYEVKDVTVAVTGGASTDKGTGTAVIGNLPEGNILLIGGISYLQFLSADADVSATWSGNYAVGSTANVAANQSLTAPTTDSDLIALATIADATAKLSPVTRGVSPAGAVVDNTSGAGRLNLNVLTDDNDVADAAAADFTVNGYVELVYMVLGDD